MNDEIMISIPMARYDELIKAERIASDKLAEWAEKAAEKVSKALSSYYSSHVEEFKGV